MNETLDLDEWLNSIGTAIEERTTEVTVQQEAQPEEVHIHMADEVVDVPIIQDSVVHSTRDVPPSLEPETISEQDFADIMQISGYNASEPADAEEIHDGSDDEGVEDEEDIRDLDAEEDADWQEAIDSRSVVAVPNYDVAVREPENINPHLMEMADNILSEASTPQREPLIPLNSPTLLMDDSTSRFSGAEWYNEVQSKNVTFAGLGGIGSWSSLLIGRMGLRTFVLYDDDKVEFANMSGQLFSRTKVGKYKSEAMRELLGDYTSTISVFSRRDRFTENSTTSNVMICGFDNMEARKTFFNAWKNHIFPMSSNMKKQCLFIDGRLSIDTLQVFCIQGDDRINMARYEEEFLFDDSEADETVCSMKQTSYLAAMIGSIITNLFTNWCANLVEPIVPYDLPFFTEYNAQHMIFKTEH